MLLWWRERRRCRVTSEWFLEWLGSESCVDIGGWLFSGKLLNVGIVIAWIFLYAQDRWVWI